MFEGLLKLAEKTPFVRPAVCEGKGKENCDGPSTSPSSTSLLKDVCPTRTFGFAAASSGRRNIEYGTTDYFLMCSLGGILSCGITHTLICPLDMIKCRMQINKAKYPGMFSGLKVAVAEEGFRVLARGWAPTLFGYSAQGFFKFGLYEYFKKYYYEQFDEETAYLNRTFIFLGASATAEFIADIALSPFEATKVRIQTKPNYPSQMRKVMPLMVAEEGYGAFFKSLVPLWCRQIPYTMMKFASFEKTVELLYKHVLQKSRAQATAKEELVTTFAAGYIAGVFCAVVSHPADTLVSKLNQDKGSSVRQIISNVGFGGLWAGLGTRIIMIGTLTGAQWLIYDGFKVYFNIPRPPPKEPPLSLVVKQKVKKISDEMKETAEDVRLRGKEFGSSIKGKTEHTAKDVKERSKETAEKAKQKTKDMGDKTGEGASDLKKKFGEKYDNLNDKKKKCKKDD